MAIPRNLANFANTLDTSGQTPKIQVGDSSVVVTDTGSNGTIAFTTDNSERARITSDGKLLVGATSSNWQGAWVGTNSGADVGFGFRNNATATSTSASLYLQAWTSDSTQSGRTRISAVKDSSAFGTDLIFYTTTGVGGNTTEAMRMNNAQGIQAANTISVGAATPSTSGAGITFPATQSASTDANTLDDYEEGTWTPSLGGNTTYSIQSGKYTKIGRLVYVSGVLSVTTLGTGSAGIISGLPFTANNPGGGNVGGGIYYFNGLAVNVIAPTTYLIQSSNNLEIKSLTTAGTTVGSSINIFGNSARVDFSLVYEV